MEQGLDPAENILHWRGMTGSWIERVQQKEAWWKGQKDCMDFVVALTSADINLNKSSNSHVSYLNSLENHA